MLSRSNVPHSSSSKGTAIKHVTFEHQMLYRPIKKLHDINLPNVQENSHYQ